jgi:hypothetical protein
MIDLDIDDFNVVIEDFGVEVSVDDEIDDLGKNLVGMALIVTDGADADRGKLPGIIIIDLGNSDFEPAADTAGNGFQDLALAFKRHIFRQAEANPGDTYIHDIKTGLLYI